MWDQPRVCCTQTFCVRSALVLILPELRIYYICPVLADTWHLFCFLGWVQSTGADGHLHRFLFPKKSWHPHLHQDSSFIQMQMNLMESIDPEKVETVEKEVRMTWQCVRLCENWCVLIVMPRPVERRKKRKPKRQWKPSKTWITCFFSHFSCSQIQAWWL